jgi:polyhydroxybutyrate depolymerase
MLTLSLFVTGSLFGTASSAGDTPPMAEGPSSPEVMEVKHGGLTRTALVYVPSRYDGKTPIPLVLSFHGRHGQGKDQANLSELHKVGERKGFLVVYPDGVAKSWNAGVGTGDAADRGIDDVGFVDALMDKLAERYRIDPDRVYASGVSNGGFFVHRLACERSNRFAAIATVAGEMLPALAKDCRVASPVAVLIFHGTRDPYVPYKGGQTKGSGIALSSEEAANVWSRNNGSTGEWKETFKKGDVHCRTSEGGRAPVRLCTVEGAGHTWPGGLQYMPKLLVGSTNRDVNASEMIWEFFEANPKRRTPGPR